MRERVSFSVEGQSGAGTHINAEQNANGFYRPTPTSGVGGGALIGVTAPPPYLILCYADTVMSRATAAAFVRFNTTAATISTVPFAFTSPPLNSGSHVRTGTG